jgi:hypothetical protein
VHYQLQRVDEAPQILQDRGQDDGTDHESVQHPIKGWQVFLVVPVIVQLRRHLFAYRIIESYHLFGLLVNEELCSHEFDF